MRAFEWDQANIGHLQRHNVEPEEAEEVLISHPLIRRTRQHRYIALGQTEHGRYLMVVFVLKPAGTARVITARDMDEAERRYYRGRYS